MAIIDPLFSILDYCECNRLVPIGLWHMADSVWFVGLNHMP